MRPQVALLALILLFASSACGAVGPESGLPSSEGGSPVGAGSTSEPALLSAEDLERVSDLVRPSLALLRTFDQAGNELQTGSAVAVVQEGILVTNAHVIEGAARIDVHFEGQPPLTGELVGVDRYTDLAVVRVDSPEPPPVVGFAGNDQVAVDDPVVAHAAPGLMQRTVAAHVLIGLSWRAAFIRHDRFIASEGYVEPGYSGGGVDQSRGRGYRHQRGSE